MKGFLPAGSTADESLWRVVLLVITAAVLIVTVFCLSQGITTIFMHLYYIPIVLLAYRYRKKGVFWCVLLSLLYLVLVAAFGPDDPAGIGGAGVRVILFIAIAVIVAFLSEHLAQAREELRKQYDELARSQHTLMEIEVEYQSILRTAMDGFGLIGPNGSIIDVNESFCTMTGYTRDELLAMSLPDIEVKESASDIAHHMAEIERKGADRFETQHRRKDGTVIDVEVSVVPSDTRGRHFVTFHHDITERKRSEERLRESEERYRSLVRNAPAMVYRMSLPDGRYEYISPSSTQISGYSPEELLESPMLIRERIHPESAVYFQEQWARLTSGDIAPFYEYKFIHKSGEVRWLHQTNTLIHNTERRVVAIEGIVTDITERKSAEEALRASEEKFRMVFENSNDPILLVEVLPTGAPGRFLDVNTIALQKLGYTKEELLSIPVTQINSFSLNRKLPSILQELTSVHSVTFEDEVVTKDGTLLPVEASIQLVKIRNVPLIVTIARDITERKRAEEALRESEEKFRGLAERSSDIVQLTDRTGRITYVSPSIRRILGFEPAEVLSSSPEDMVHPEDLGAVRELIRKNIEGGANVEGSEVRVRKKDGGYAILEVFVSPVIKDGVYSGMQVMGRDITGRKQAEAELKRYSETLETKVTERTRELREAQEQLVKKEKLAVLGKLAGGVGHELRNPLGAVKNAAYFLNMVLENPEPDVKESLEIMNTEISRSEDILSSLLDFARPTVLTLRKVKMNTVISESVARSQLPENIRLVMNLDEALPEIQADPDKLLQVFTNLVTNAVQAMGGSGELTVKSMVPEAGGVMVSVSDTGSGITEENMKKLFEPLFTTKAKGIGLGLVVTRAIVEAHHGCIDVRSTVGKGTTFTVTLPAGPGEVY